MFAITYPEILPLLVEDGQGMEQDSVHIKFVIEETESNVAEVDKIYVEIKSD